MIMWALKVLATLFLIKIAISVIMFVGSVIIMLIDENN